MNDEVERQAITAAIDRLLTGKPLRSSGHLDIVTLAQEAGVKRNKLTHKHRDLKDLFYARREARNQVPDNEIKLRDQNAILRQQIQRLRADRDRYKLASETFARAIHVLTVENDTLRTNEHRPHLRAAEPEKSPPGHSAEPEGPQPNPATRRTFR